MNILQPKYAKVEMKMYEHLTTYICQGRDEDEWTSYNLNMPR